jgi:polyisoprenoid-binding protein YceI
MRSLLFPCLLLLPAIAWAGAAVQGAPKVSFHAEGSPGALDIEGTTSQLQVRDDGTTLTFAVGLDSVTTGIGVRDHHMKDEYAQTSLYPEATLTVPRAAIHWPVAVGEASPGVVTGTFTAHGVSQPAQVKYQVKKTKTGDRISAEFDFDVSRHGIAIPSYLGVTVDPKMHAEATFDLTDIQ